MQKVHKTVLSSVDIMIKLNHYISICGKKSPTVLIREHTFDSNTAV